MSREVILAEHVWGVLKNFVIVVLLLVNIWAGLLFQFNSSRSTENAFTALAPPRLHWLSFTQNLVAVIFKNMTCTHVQSYYCQERSDFTNQYLTMKKKKSGIKKLYISLINLKLLYKVPSIIKELHRLQHYACHVT